MDGFTGQSVRRFEDHRFLTGAGRFVDDIVLPGQAFLAIVRSPHAHARITGMDLAAARAVPGVLGVFTQADLAADGLGAIPCTTRPPTVGPLLVPERFALASDRVRHVGEPVAFVVAETREAARDAAEAVLLDYDPLPVVVDAAAALEPGAPLLWDSAPGNLSYRFQKGNAEAAKSGLAAAAHVVEINIVNNRLIIAPMEHRGAIGEYDAATGVMRLTFSGAGVHALRNILADTIFRVPREKMQVVCPDVGGGFGVKNALYAEQIAVLWAARKLGRPVKWMSGHTEDFISTAQGRDNITRARLGLDASGKFLALDVETIANLGAFLSIGGPGSSTTAPGNAMGCGYAIPAIFMDVRGAFTNTVPIDAYRGAGKPEANYIIERLIDAAAPVVGIDPVELRRRNLVREFPYPTPMNTTIDCGGFAQNIDPALAAADYAGFGARREASAARGLLRGVGVTCFLETARGANDEGAEIRFEKGGKVAIIFGTQSNGQGHETAFPQICADRLGLPMEAFHYIQADTFAVRDGNGHGGARSLHMAGSALVKVIDAVIAKGKPIAARLLQAKEADVSFSNGAYHADGTSVGLLEVAEAERSDAGTPLDTYIWNPLDKITFPNGVHVAEVEIDPDTGLVTLDRYTCVDDYGNTVNPMLTIGQVQGGLAQGIGQAMLEHTAYDAETGQLLSGSFMDYCLPRAADLPDLNVTLSGVPTSANPLGVKGAGQAGAISAPPAVTSAILNALASRGVTHIDMPATPEKVWRALQGVR
jgi:carbon-monoxide dehydrogenase large subunit